MRIRICLVMRVTCNTSEGGIICRVYVASRAGHPYALIVGTGVDREPCVIKGRSGPGRCRVTSLASRRESGGDVVRIRRTCVLRLVARIAVGRCRREISIDVATGARHASMRSGKRKHRLAVIKRRGRPVRGTVTKGAILRESAGDVVGIGGLLELCQVA